MLVRTGELPAEPLTASAQFHGEQLADVQRRLSAETFADREPEHLLIVFPPADHAHRAWRLAVVQELARAHAPVRVNAVASDDDAAIAAAQRYLDGAPGVTGQYFTLDGHGA
jgi:hypothetical protein